MYKLRIHPIYIVIDYIHASIGNILRSISAMFQLKCCGVMGPTDWPEKTRPLSCCHPPREGAALPADYHCRDAQPEDQILYSDGCYGELKGKAQSSANVLMGVGIGIAFIEVILES